MEKKYQYLILVGFVAFVVGYVIYLMSTGMFKGWVG